MPRANAMKAKLFKVVLFLAGLVLLQQAIALGNRHNAQLHDQAGLVSRYDIDPAALFYMELDLALAAEKTIRKKLKN